MTPIVVCTVTGVPLPILEASVRAYCPDVPFLAYKVERSSFGSSFNMAMEEAFKKYDEVIIANDDIVLNPNSYRLLMEDVVSLKEKHLDNLGIVSSISDAIRPHQNIRYRQREGDTLDYKWSWEGEVREAGIVGLGMAWVSKKAFESCKIPPINWYSDDIWCLELGEKGFKHFISRSYVHHAGSVTIGNDDYKNQLEAKRWIYKNAPKYFGWFFANEEGIEKMEDKKLKICVYGISKNEEKFIQRWAESAKQADLILLADTGSDDRTVELAKQSGVEVHHINIKPWRFDHARNAALCLIPGDFDVCVSLDIDEILEPGWREEIERLWTPETTRMRYIFDWGFGKKFYHVKIHSRHSHFWKHACHEVPVTDMRTPERFCFTEKQMVTHYPDHTKSRAQYFDILKVAVEEDPSCPRNAFYWARELSYYSKWEEALVALQKYLDMPSAVWNCERCYAYITMSKCYGALGNLAEEEKSLLKAAMEAPETREPWVGLADFCYRHGRWPECFAYAMKAVNITHRANNYTEDPNCWGWRPHDFAAISAFRLGLKDVAVEQGKKALEIEPEDKRLQNNLQWYIGQIS